MHLGAEGEAVELAVLSIARLNEQVDNDRIGMTRLDLADTNGIVHPDG